MKQSTSILVCCHKNDYWYDGEGFCPIQVGKSISKVNLNIVSDDTGDNISEKNPYYCELTALYWYWKNSNKFDYIGLNHYRRYFDFSKGNKWGIAQIFNSEKQIKANPPILPNVKDIFNKYDIVLPKPLVSQFPIATQYCLCHISNDIKILKSTIMNLYPDYLPAYEKVMEAGNKFSPYNMFLTKKIIFEDYASWLFSILSDVERNIKISEYTDQARVFGYMAERLMNIYVVHNKLKVKYVPILKVSDEKRVSRPKEILLNCLKTVMAKTYMLLKNVK